MTNKELLNFELSNKIHELEDINMNAFVLNDRIATLIKEIGDIKKKLEEEED